MNTCYKHVDMLIVYINIRYMNVTVMLPFTADSCATPLTNASEPLKPGNSGLVRESHEVWLL